MTRVAAAEDPAVVKKVVSVLREAKVPASTDYVAHGADLTWATARAVLLDLALIGKVKATKTTKSWVFELPEGNETDC